MLEHVDDSGEPCCLGCYLVSSLITLDLISFFADHFNHHFVNQMLVLVLKAALLIKFMFV